MAERISYGFTGELCKNLENRDIPYKINLIHLTPDTALTYVEKGKYSNFHPVIGDDLDLNSWPKGLDLSKTDLWFFDSLHTEDQLRKELELYKPFFKKGAIILFDDIFLPELESVWQDLENIIPVAYKTALPLHYTGWGLVQIGDK